MSLAPQPTISNVEDNVSTRAARSLAFLSFFINVIEMYKG